MMKNPQWYVSVLGPYDQAYVGPFDSQARAEIWKGNSELISPQFDYCVITEEAMNANIAEFGPIPIETPNWIGN